MIVKGLSCQQFVVMISSYEILYHITVLSYLYIEALSFVFTHNNNNKQRKEELMMADTGKKFVIKVSTYLCFFV